MARKVSREAKFVGDSIATGELYPHLKITHEKYPRLLVTRKILDRTGEYFGAFLPPTSVRVWLYHLNRIFRLRSCDIPLDGTFPQPCARFFSKQCVAPCVALLCGREEYLERVSALRLFLRGDGRAFDQFVAQKINEFAGGLEFETAAAWRDLGTGAQLLAANNRFDIRLERAVDTYSVVETADSYLVYLVTSRGRRLVGNKEFIFERSIGRTAETVLETVLRGFYQFHVPREIRLPFATAEATELRHEFFERFGREVKFSVSVGGLNHAAKNRLKRTRIEFGLEKIGEELSPDEIGAELKKLFGLRKKPRRIEAFDVAHISNLDFVAASGVWVDGELRPDRMGFWSVAAENEPQAMARGIRERLLEPPAPGLIVVDGGKGQLSAVLEVLKEADASGIPVIAAAKPAGKPHDISHFFTANGELVDFVPGNRAFELLRELRDEAHQNANELHRQQRESRALFENVNITLLLSLAERKRLLDKFGSVKAIGEAPLGELSAIVGKERAERIKAAAGIPTVLPLVVTRLNEIGGAANDLRPIRANIEK